MQVGNSLSQLLYFQISRTNLPLTRIQASLLKYFLQVYYLLNPKMDVLLAPQNLFSGPDHVVDKRTKTFCILWIVFYLVELQLVFLP